MSFPNLAQALEETFNTSLCINICMVKHRGLIFHDLTATAFKEKTLVQQFILLLDKSITCF